MAEKPKGISQETAEAYALLGIPYEGYVEGIGYQSLLAQTLGSCYFQERGCAIPQFEPVMDSSPEMRIQSVGYKHLVKAGETLTSISQYYGATIASIMAANPGIDWLNARNNGDLIFVGEELALPKGGQDDLLPTDPSASTCMFQFSASNEVRRIMAGGAGNGGGNTIYAIGMGLNAAGFFSSAGEYSNVVNGAWRGVNGNWNSLKWGGNQWTGARAYAIRKAGYFKLASRGFFVVGTGISLYQGGDALINGNYEGAAKSTLDIGMGAFATFGGPPGWIIGGGYFALDALGAFDGPVGPSSYTPTSFAVQDNTFVAPRIIRPLR